MPVATTVASLPVIVLFAVMQRHLIAGIAFTAPRADPWAGSKDSRLRVGLSYALLGEPVADPPAGWKAARNAHQREECRR
ncbi:hypothetical protein E1286_33895 [Nonomuraea terrae]|uniref:Uncharacterized protein n=1 Tax=Nonomuraea terrae TaxID=2530383 RepID=A0A4R4YAI2_9ACTN|nr:hypothetical protein E1286_33895 [Nonomuraea terrae]